MDDIPVGLRELVKKMCWTRIPEEEAQQLAGLILTRLANEGWLASKMSRMDRHSRWWSVSPTEVVNLDHLDSVTKRDQHGVTSDELDSFLVVGYAKPRYHVLFESNDEEERDVIWDELVAHLGR